MLKWVIRSVVAIVAVAACSPYCFPCVHFFICSFICCFGRRKEGPLEDDLRPMVAKVLSAVSKSVNTYYAFGSVYVDDST